LVLRAVRVLNVSATIDPVFGGGTAERTVQLSRGFARLGAECAVLTLDLGITAERREQLRDVALTALPSLWPRYYLFAWANPRIDERVAWADVIQLTNHWTLLNAVVYRAAQRLAKPYVVCPAGALAIYGRSAFLKKAYNHFVGRDIVRRASAGVAIAEQEFAHFAQYGLPAAKTKLIPNGVDPADFADADARAWRTKLGLPDAPLVLFMGRLNAIKGPDLLLEAFMAARLAGRGYHLVFAGPDGGMLAALREAAARAEVKANIHFVGPVSPRERASAYAACEFLAIPSRQEAMSIVVLEAGVCDRPVLITEQCGFNEVARIGGGRVVGATSDAIRAGLLELAASPAQLREMGKRLGAFVRGNFTWEASCRRYLDLFEQVRTQTSFR
jgi:glycosyltransferase involved in cell wall biosynthesis